MTFLPIFVDLSTITKYLAAVVLFLMAWSCEPENPDDLPLHVRAIDSLIVLSENETNTATVHFEKEITFRDSLLLDQINALEVDSKDNLFIAGESWNRRQVHIFKSDGSYRDSLGNYGEGFGQFLDISRLKLRKEALYIFDDQLNRVTSFNNITGEIIDTTGLHADANHLPQDWKGFQSVPVTIREDGSYLVAFKRDRNPAYEPEGEIHFYEVNETGEVVSGKILDQQDIRYLIGDYAGRPAPFTLSIPEKPLVAFSENERVYTAFTDEFLIHVRGKDGDHLYSYYYPYNRHNLDPNEVMHPKFSHNEQLLRVRESAVYPEKWPALYSLLPDDENRIWISTVTENRDELKWWLIDDGSGKIVATFHWPFNKPIYFVKNESVYTVEQNERGFREVIRYKFELSD